MPVNIGNTVDAVLTYAREYLCIRPGSRKQNGRQGVIGIEAVRTARSRIIVARARQAWTISAVSIALDLLTVAVEEPCLQEVTSPYFGKVVLHRVEILMVAVRSNVPHRGLARAAARVASDITVRIQPAPSAEELILLLDRLR